MTIKQAELEYNKLLVRYNKATKYFESDATQEVKESHLEGFNEVLKGLNYYLNRVGPYTSKQVLEGFI